MPRSQRFELPAFVAIDQHIDRDAEPLGGRPKRLDPRLVEPPAFSRNAPQAADVGFVCVTFQRGRTSRVIGIKRANPDEHVAFAAAASAMNRLSHR